MERTDRLWPDGPLFYFDDSLFAPGTDSFLLASFTRTRSGERVCDLGAGTGLLGLLLLARQPELELHNVEIQEAALALAEKTYAANGIAAVNAHTNLDCCHGGVNDVLARVLGLAEITVPSPMGTDEAGHPYGLLRAGLTVEQPLSQFLDLVKERLGTPVLRYVDGGRPVHRVAVGGGSCGDCYEEALEAGCDTLVTADVKYNQFWEAQTLGLNLIDAGHFYTENPVCSVLAESLRQKLPGLEVLLSESHRDCMKFA